MRALGKKAGDEFAFLGKAESFTSSLSESLSLDPDLMMNYQAIFAQMSSSMGVTESAAYDLSESFTMLGADIASLFNIDVESAYQKLQSALSGQARAMREFGVDISVATMQEKAYALGIKNISEVKIPRLADGGVLNSGQMFIAREAGPELVANLGRQTAVMNNDQIVESVSNGVAAANYEQNAILRELVYIGKKILEKNTVVNATVSTDDIIRGLAEKNRRAGRTIVPVGY